MGLAKLNDVLTDNKRFESAEPSGYRHAFKVFDAKLGALYVINEKSPNHTLRWWPVMVPEKE